MSCQMNTEPTASTNQSFRMLDVIKKMQRSTMAATVSQSFTPKDQEAFRLLGARRKKTAAFEEWRRKLNKGSRLPRGKFFRGKKPGLHLVILDEFGPFDRKIFVKIETEHEE